MNKTKQNRGIKQSVAALFGLVPAPLRTAWELTTESLSEWRKDGGAQLGAALAFYTIISLAPLLIVVIMIAGVVFGEDAAQGEIMAQIIDLIGYEGAVLVEEMLVKASQPQEGILPQALGLAALIFGATQVFYQLRESLNRIWDTRSDPYHTVISILRARALAFTTVLGVGFLLLVSLVVSAALAALHSYTAGLFFGAEILVQALNIVIPFMVISVLFALLFRVLPNAKVRWRYALIGGSVTALLFSIGKFAIGWYLGQRAIGSVYGAAGSLVVLLIWIYYSAQIMLLGAEFTKVYHRRVGAPEDGESLIEPAPVAKLPNSYEN